MAECPGGRTNRGTRSQFRLGLPGLGQCKRFYPIHLGNIMDTGQSSQTGISSSRDLISPSKGTRTLTVREYEQTISELKKENFDLKLKLFLFDEAVKKSSRKDKDSLTPDKDIVQVVVQLHSETDSLRNELSYKDKLLQEAVAQIEKIELDLKEMQKKYTDLQVELSSLSELPSKEEFLSLVAEKENLIKHTELQEKILMEKEEEIDNVKQKIEILANQNSLLEEKVKKRSIAIQSFVHKNHKEKEMLPDELRNIMIFAIQAAKNKNKDHLTIAIKQISSALYQMMTSVQILSDSEEKENMGSPQNKCLNEEMFEKSSPFHSSHIDSPTEISHIQSLKDVLTERNTPGTKQSGNLDSFVFDSSYMRGLSQSESPVNFSALSPSEENLISFSNRHSSQSPSVAEDELIETAFASEESDQLIKVLKENEKLQHDLKEKLTFIKDLSTPCKDLESKAGNSQVAEGDALKASKLYNSVFAQTDFAGSNLLNESEIKKLQKDAKLSSNVEELREDILLLLLAVEGKDKELSEVKQSLSAVQEDLKKALNTTNVADKDFYMNERNELHERLALSCSVNEELMKHLKSIEKFMENLLLNKSDSSINESICENSDLFPKVSKCLNESLKLSYILSDHLSVCEGSKLFEECESFVYKNGNDFEEKSLPHLSLSQLDLPERDSSSYPGTRVLEEYIPCVRKRDQNMRKDSDGSQLCWRCWQQLNHPENQLETSHLMQNNIVPRHIGYPSSESDIWSEPDRNVSMQRIGISLQNSPVASKSPRRLRLKDKRMSGRLSSEQDTSSSELQHVSKKRHGSASRRLFSKESIKNQDFISEKFYCILSEKYPKLKSLLNDLKNIKDRKLSNEVWIRLNAIVASLGEALKKLHIARENAKSFPCAVCGKCVMLELFSDLKASHAEGDFFIENSSSEQDILQQLSKEIRLLEEACKEPFPLFSENISKRSQSMQSDPLIENEEIKINELEDVIASLNEKNRELNKNLDEMKMSLSKEKETLKLIKTDNSKLSNQIDYLKNELTDLKHKEKELHLKNEKIMKDLTDANRYNSELNSTLKDLEQKREESNVVLDQLTNELQKNKSDLINMNKKCLEYEKQLNEQIQVKEDCENKFKTLKSNSLSEKNYYLTQIDDLNAEKQHYVQELENIQEKKLFLEEENMIIRDSLESKNNELLFLQETIEKLKYSNETLVSNCTKLQNEIRIANEKLAYYEKEVIVKFKENEAEYCRQLKQLEAKSLSEKKKLLDEFSLLKNEKENILQQLKEEKEYFKKLMAEKVELDHYYAESCQQISTLKTLNEELKSKQSDLLQRKESFENSLHSSNKQCDNLNKDLKYMRDTLQNLESKCLVYEKQLVAAAGMKDTLVECLLNINKEFSVCRQKLNKKCKAYGSEILALWDEAAFDGSIPVIDEDNVQKLCDSISSETKKLLQSVDMLLELLKSSHFKSVESKASEEKAKKKTTSKKTQVELVVELDKVEMDRLKLQNSHLLQVSDDIQKSISEKEKSVQFSAYEIQCLKEKLDNAAKEIEKGNQLLKKKDDELISLQERIFDLQTYVNTIMADKTDLPEKLSEISEKSVKDSVPPNDLLSSSPVLKDTKMCQTSGYEDTTQSADDTLSSVSSLETSRNRCCEKYSKKCHSLQAKLTLCKRHIEILEKDKNDLRESLLQQLQNKNDPMEKKDSVSSKLAELESKLEQKKAFISELKGELLKTCNCLIDKEKELDDFKRKLAEYEEKFRRATFDASDRHSISSPKSIDANVNTLKNYKWQLIQTIFDIQRKFYEKRGIHLNYIDRFKDHVNNLYSMQLTHSLSKSESMPLLGSQVMEQPYEQENDGVKNLVSLELDIECLENLKIFLNRFFVPCVLQTPKIADEKISDFKGETSFDKSLEEVQRESKLGITDFLGIPLSEAFSIADREMISPEKNLSFDNFASTISLHLDYVLKFFLAVRKCHWLDKLDFSAEASTEKAEVKSLLQKIFQVINSLHKEADKLFEFNALLKKFDLVALASVRLNTSRPDVSDRESVMSEETIAVSRTDSPLSFEDVCPIKLPHPGTLPLEEREMKSESAGKVTVIEPFGAKGTAIGSSWDSVCQRSHYSSPDLGIESDPNHDSSAPEQKEDGINKYQRQLEEQKSAVKPQKKSAFTSTEIASRWSDHKFGEILYAIGTLPNYELLRQEVKESLVAIKSVLSRTGDGLHHIAKYTSPRKTLEYNTMKSIKDTCVHIEVCLKEANNLVGKFWTAPCPTEKEWKLLNDENQSMSEQLARLKIMIQKQETEFKKALGSLEHAQVRHASMEKKISKKLVKTKKVIRQAELKLLENRCQNFPPMPKYPSDQTEHANTSSMVHQM